MNTNLSSPNPENLLDSQLLKNMKQRVLRYFINDSGKPMNINSIKK